MYIFSPPRRRQGSFLILAAVLLPLFLLVAGACVDIGAMYIAKSNQQNAADAAALAGAQELPNASAATAKAREYLMRNGFSQTVADAANVEILESNTKCRVTFEAPAPLVVFGGLFDGGPTIRARAAAIGQKGGGYAIFAGDGRESGYYHPASLIIQCTYSKISGKIHSNYGIHAQTQGPLIFNDAELTSSKYIPYAGVSPKIIPAQPFPAPPAEYNAYIKAGRYRDAESFTPEIYAALKNGEIDGIRSSGKFYLPGSGDTLDTDALKKLRFIIAKGDISSMDRLDFLPVFSYLGTETHPILLLSETGDVTVRTVQTKGMLYADLYASKGHVSVQLNIFKFAGSVAGNSVDLQISGNSTFGSNPNSGQSMLRLVE